jgi:hypothetical protein
MTRLVALVVIAGALMSAHASAQQPPRPNDTPRTATLSLSEYNRLIDLASRPPQPSSIPPVASTLASADLRIRVDRDLARGVFALTGEVLRPGLNRVPLLSGATIIDASVAGQPLPLVAEGNAHAALLPGPGPFAVSLEWGTPLAFSPGRGSFVLPVPPSGAARATIDVPGEEADVHLSSGLITRRTTNSGRTIVEATLDPGSSTEVWWSMRDSAPIAAAREARSLADVFTLITIGDSEVRLVSLVDITVVQGDPRTFEVRVPAGYELSGISGSSLEASEPRAGSIVLTVTDPTLRRHQFLVNLERQHEGGSFVLDTDLASLPGVQRERGEVAIEGVGTLELTATEREGMHRMDVRELNAALHSLARLPVLAAFRYQRSPTQLAGLNLAVKRFADAPVLAAVADRAVATTLVTSEGRALTEIALTVHNRAQPFLKVTLPSGASIVSVDVAGEPAKPVIGVDGTRVPLLRPGFRPAGPYTVTFVYLHAGTPFEKKGELQMTLPRMDVPVGIVEWEVFAPDRYSLRPIDGNVIERSLVSMPSGALSEFVTVAAEDEEKGERQSGAGVPSQNVINLQRRAAGVLPVRVDVPRAGTSHQFVKPLVVDQAAFVSFRYKRRSS